MRFFVPLLFALLLFTCRHSIRQASVLPFKENITECSKDYKAEIERIETQFKLDPYPFKNCLAQARRAEDCNALRLCIDRFKQIKK